MTEEPKQFRPRLSVEEYRVVQAMKNGWKPDMTEVPEITAEGERKSPAKILIFDIETAPMRSYTWGMWKQNVGTNQVISDWFMLTWSAKWLFAEDTMSGALTPDEAIDQDDERITRQIWDLLNEADIIVAHNANKFDVRKLNTRFLKNGLNPPMPYQVIDTLDHLRKRFSFSSNRLDYVNKELGIGRKMDTGGFELWDGCIRGDQESLDHMERYNIIDVEILEETYLKLRPWINPHPNIGLFIEDDVETCPSCGSTHIAWGGTPYTTSVNRFESFRCNDCGSVGRSRKSLAGEKKTAKTPTTSVAR
jgi:hypothetical protein